MGLVQNIKETINTKSKRLTGDFHEPMEFDLKTWIIGTPKESAVQVEKLLIADIPNRISRALSYTKTYKKSFKNTNFGAYMSFNGYAKMDNQGAHGGVSGWV